jgi:hypothetical protein
MSGVKVGTITVHAGRKYTQHYETAAWFTDYLIEPGTYDVWAHPYCGSRDGVYWQPSFKAPGTITAEFFSNGFGGFYTPCADNGKNVGKTELVHAVKCGANEIDYLPGFAAGRIGYIVEERAPAWAKL